MEDANTLVEQLLTEITGGRKAITPGKYLVDDLGFDSLKMVDLMLALEDRLDVVIPIADAARIHTVADLCAEVERMLQMRSNMPAPPLDSRTLPQRSPAPAKTL